MNNMNITNRRKAKYQSNRPDMLTIEQKQLDILQKLYDVQKTQQRGTIERVPDVPRIILKRDKVYTFIRSFEAGTILNSTTGPVGYANAPSLSSLPISGDISDDWEQWRFIQLTWTFVPLTTGTVQNPIYTWFDQDDDSTPTDINGALQSETMRATPLGTSIERTCTPQISMSGSATGSASSGYVAPSNNLWCDEAYPGTKYYGIKALAPANNNLGAAVPLYVVTGTAVVQVRRPK